MSGKNWTYIADCCHYRFSERVTEGLLKVPDLQVVKLTIQNQIAADQNFEICTIEMKIFIPIFTRYYELRNESQEVRIKLMREFLSNNYKTFCLK